MLIKNERDMSKSGEGDEPYMNLLENLGLVEYLSGGVVSRNLTGL